MQGCTQRFFGLKKSDRSRGQVSVGEVINIGGGEAGWVGSDSIKEAKIEETGGISDTALSTTQD